MTSILYVLEMYSLRIKTLHDFYVIHSILMRSRPVFLFVYFRMRRRRFHSDHKRSSSVDLNDLRFFSIHRILINSIHTNNKTPKFLISDPVAKFISFEKIKFISFEWIINVKNEI